MAEELKPCPFCGGLSDDVHLIGSAWFVGGEHTPDCHLADFQRTKDEAIAAWNRRAEQSDNAVLHADVERLKEAVGPVLHWYQSDEEHERPLADIVEDIVADLQSDRAALGASSPATPRGPIDWRDGPPPDELKDGRQVLLKLKDGFFAIATCYMKDHMGTNTSHWWNFSDHGVSETYVIAHCPVTP